MDHDALFKQLLTEFFVEFLELFAPDLAAELEPDSLTFLDKETFGELLDPDRREADLVVQARLRGEPASFVVHVEHQAQGDSTLHRRMFRYFARLHDRYDQPIYPIALCSYRSPREPAPDRYDIAFRDLAVLNFRFRVVQLNRMRWRDFLRHPNPVAAALMTRMRITRRERVPAKLAIVANLAGVALSEKRRALLRSFVEIYLQLTPLEQREYEAELLQAVPDWKEERMLDILSLPEVVGQRNMLAKMLTHRFGELSAETQANVADLSVEQVAALGRDIFSMQTMADVEDWMARNPATGYVNPVAEFLEDYDDDEDEDDLDEDATSKA
jgi:hypothetical protein